MKIKTLTLLPMLSILALPMAGGTRLTFDIQGRSTPIHWSAAKFPLSTTIDSAVVRAIPSSFEKLDRARATWQVEGSGVSFQRPLVGTAVAGKDGVNGIAVNDRLFEDSGFLAYTTTWFDDAGVIQEADIQIDSQSIDGYDVQSLIEHELGHFLGLDHSGVVGAVMYPYIAKTPVPLDSDDRVTLSAIYPSPALHASTATIRGEVRAATGAIFAAQVVAISESGIAVASTLTDRSGSFVLSGLPAGQYRLYAEPLDGPVSRDHLSGIWRSSNQRSFVTRFGDPQSINAKTGSQEQRVVLQIDDATPTLNPRWIGAFPPNSSELRLASTPVNVSNGETAIAIGGDGVIAGITTFELLTPGVERVGDFRYGPNYVYATFRFSAQAPNGSIAVVAKNGSETAMLTGALRFTAGASSSRVRGAR